MTGRLARTAGRCLAAVSVAAMVAAAPAGAWAQASSGLRPANLRPTSESAEGGLWLMAEKAEVHVKGAAELNKEAALNAYVEQVVCKLAADYCEELRVYVLDRPLINASAAPNGYFEIHSGLLLRARTEDELAFVLGHEITHFARNHSLAEWERTKRTANGIMVLQLAVAAGGAAAAYGAAANGASYGTIDAISSAAQSVSDLVYLAGIASLYGYSREQETESDRLGFERAVWAGYSKDAGVGMWSEALAEALASDFPKVRENEVRASIFKTHPITPARIDALIGMGGTRTEPDLAAQKTYRAVIRPHLGAWLKDDLRRRDAGQSLYLIDRLSKLGEDMGVLLFYRGEALRQRRGPDDGPAALAAYKAAAAYPDAPAATWRELGEAQRKQGDRAAAADAFRTYLTRAPEAEDRWLVEATLKSLEAST